MPVPYALNAVSSYEVVQALQMRIIAAVSDPALATPKPAAGYVRFTNRTDAEDGAAYKGEEGVHIIVGDPQPFTKDGAGRAGKRVRRVFEVWLVTRNNQDRVGDMVKSLQQHLDLEDLVIDALDDTPPDGGPVNSQTPIGIIFRWIPGGEEIRRRKKVGPDVLVSVHLFEVHYVQKMRVVRSVF